MPSSGQPARVQALMPPQCVDLASFVCILRLRRSYCEACSRSQPFNLVAVVSAAIATPVNWKEGDEVVILPSIKNEEADKLFPQGYREIKSYLRMTTVKK